MKEINKGYQEPILGGINLQLFADEGEGEEPKQPEEPEGPSEPEEPEKGFTQEDVNNIAAKESRKAQEKLFKELGIEDFEDAKEGMKKFREWQESQKTEAEKRDEKLESLEKEHLDTKSENEFLKAQITATKQGVIPDAIEDVVTLAQNLVSEEKDMENAIQEVIEKYPHFADVQEEEGKDDKPFFSSGEHSTGKGKKLSDPFQAKIDKYKK